MTAVPRRPPRSSIRQMLARKRVVVALRGHTIAPTTDVSVIVQHYVLYVCKTPSLLSLPSFTSPPSLSFPLPSFIPTFFPDAANWSLGDQAWEN